MYGIKKKLGFGCMRLPMIDEKTVDYTEFCKMVDIFMENGFNYYDTANGYVGGMSEESIKACITSRYPRESYILTDKLSGNLFEKNEDIRPLFEKQLKNCGVEYFDFYLMHCQTKDIFEHFKECRAYETVFEFMKEGRVKHFGISFHDTADVLEKILIEYPQIEVVQLQFNYIDFKDPAVQSRKCYEVCRKYGKPVIVMEPVKGGGLVNIPNIAKKVFEDLNGGSAASYAIRFCAGFDGVMMVLSGMGNTDMMNDNVSFMKDFKPLNEEEKKAISKVCDILKNQDVISCTACKYCLTQCPQSIAIPEYFAIYNSKKAFGNDLWNQEMYYGGVSGAKPADCIKCGSCEKSCPQHLNIRELLEKVSKDFE